MTTPHPDPPHGVGDDPPALFNLVRALLRLLEDLSGRDVLTDDDQLRILALLAVLRRFHVPTGDQP